MLKRKECVLISGTKTERKPEITIAIPTYKRCEYLKKAIDSALNQINYSKYYEVIVIDNEAVFEEDQTETEKLIKSYHDERLFYYRNVENVGMNGNWNQCIALTKGRWVAMLHDDDCLDENYLERIDYYINKYIDAKCFIPAKREIDGVDCLIASGKQYKRNERMMRQMKRKEVTKKLDIDDKIRGCNHYGAPTAGVIFEKKGAEEIGGFNENIKFLADWDFFVRFRQKFTIYSVNEILGSYRWAVNIGTLYRKTEAISGIKDSIHCIYLTSKCVSFMTENMRKRWIDLQKSLIYIEHKEDLKDKCAEVGINKPGLFEYCQAYVFAVIRRIYIYFRIFYI